MEGLVIASPRMLEKPAKLALQAFHELESVICWTCFFYSLKGKNLGIDPQINLHLERDIGIFKIPFD